MPNTDQAQVPLRNIFDLLDQLRSILKTVEGNFKVSAGNVTVSMTPPQIQELKNQYINLINQIQTTVKKLPDANAFFP